MERPIPAGDDNKVKVLIFGASGIIGQHMRLCVPPNITPVWYRHHADPITAGFDLRQLDKLPELLEKIDPDVVVNLAGESDVDKVQGSFHNQEFVVTDEDRDIYSLNVFLPRELAAECMRIEAKYVHVSSQAVFSGEHPPYGPYSVPNMGKAANEYGWLKIVAENLVKKAANTVIVRPSFVLGVRPLPHVGRKNPLESMLDGSQPRQVADRFFSPLFAQDAAEGIWNAVTKAKPGDIWHLGIPEPTSRYEVALHFNNNVVPVSHNDFKDLAPRPGNTAYCECEPHRTFSQAIQSIHEDQTDLADRAKEIALFFGWHESRVKAKLSFGFGSLHNDVTTDFRRFGAENNDERLLEWYRMTEAYIWELSAYHLDERFNYSGMCKGIGERLAQVIGPGSVLCLGDGIGDLTLSLTQMDRFNEVVYHDLSGSQTARYAQFRYWRKTGNKLPMHTSLGWWPPDLRQCFDAVVSLDFLEHVTDVEAWVRAIYAALTPGGWLVAQNAFACGSGPDGPMPMHLARNDRFEKDWDPLLKEVGFRQEGSNWYQKI